MNLDDEPPRSMLPVAVGFGVGLALFGVVCFINSTRPPARPRPRPRNRNPATTQPPQRLVKRVKNTAAPRGTLALPEPETTPATEEGTPNP